MAQIEFKIVPGHPGYRIGTDGTLQSCLAYKGQGRGKAGKWVESEEWRTLKPDVSNRGRPRYRLRTDHGKYTHLFAHVILKKVFGEEFAEQWLQDQKNSRTPPRKARPQ